MRSVQRGAVVILCLALAPFATAGPPSGACLVPLNPGDNAFARLAAEWGSATHGSREWVWATSQLPKGTMVSALRSTGEVVGPYAAQGTYVETEILRRNLVQNLRLSGAAGAVTRQSEISGMLKLVDVAAEYAAILGTALGIAAVVIPALFQSGCELSPAARASMAAQGPIAPPATCDNNPEMEGCTTPPQPPTPTKDPKEEIVIEHPNRAPGGRTEDDPFPQRNFDPHGGGVVWMHDKPCVFQWSDYQWHCYRSW